MNSYMLPHGARSTASPRVTTATRCATMPSALNAAATLTQGPASQMAFMAPARGAGTFPVPLPAGTAGAADSAGPAAEPAPALPLAAPALLLAAPAPTVASCAVAGTAAAFAAAAVRRGRPKA